MYLGTEGRRILNPFQFLKGIIWEKKRRVYWQEEAEKGVTTVNIPGKAVLWPVHNPANQWNTPIYLPLSQYLGLSI